MPLPDTLATVNAMVEPTNEVNMLEAMPTARSDNRMRTSTFCSSRAERLQMSKRSPLETLLRPLQGLTLAFPLAGVPRDVPFLHTTCLRVCSLQRGTSFPHLLVCLELLA